jgi:transposase
VANLDEHILAELQMLRKLKMVELTEAGYSQAKLGEMLGVSQQTVSKMMAKPKKKAGEAKGDL